ncbi:hypothetical protein ACC685_33540 [Rhizobium ruizarguesonis]
MATEEVPPTDAAAATVPKGAIDARLDVALIATRGHVLSARVNRLTGAFHWPMIGLALVAVYGVYRTGWTYISPPTVPTTIAQALTFDPDSYFDLGGGLRGSAAMAWMGNYAPKPESLSAADYDALTAAVRTDLELHGFHPENWTAVAGLKTKPQITRPEKAISQYADRLPSGIILLPEDESVASVVGHVAGQWAVTLFRGGVCQTILGPLPAGCADMTKQDGVSAYIASYFDSIKPKPAAPKE